MRLLRLLLLVFIGVAVVTLFMNIRNEDVIWIIACALGLTWLYLCIKELHVL